MTATRTVPVTSQQSELTVHVSVAGSLKVRKKIKLKTHNILMRSYGYTTLGAVQNCMYVDAYYNQYKKCLIREGVFPGHEHFL